MLNMQFNSRPNSTSQNIKYPLILDTFSNRFPQNLTTSFLITSRWTQWRWSSRLLWFGNWRHIFLQIYTSLAKSEIRIIPIDYMTITVVGYISDHIKVYYQEQHWKELYSRILLTICLYCCGCVSLSSFQVHGSCCFGSHGVVAKKTR